MSFILFLIAGFFAGLLGGMGMGGGTILIPALTVLLGVEQHVAQATNLIAFLPMAAFTLNVQKKKRTFKNAGSFKHSNTGGTRFGNRRFRRGSVAACYFKKAFRRVSCPACRGTSRQGKIQLLESSFLTGRIVNISRQYRKAAEKARHAGAQITSCQSTPM